MFYSNWSQMTNICQTIRKAVSFRFATLWHRKGKNHAGKEIMQPMPLSLRNRGIWQGLAEGHMQLCLMPCSRSAPAMGMYAQM